MSKTVLIGVILGPHGVRGEVRIKSFTADPTAITRYDPVLDASGRRLDVTWIGQKKDIFQAKLGGVSERTAAERLKGTRLFTPRSALPPLPEEEFYYQDLMGLRVEDRDGRFWGVVRDVINFGAGDILEVAGPEIMPLLLPFTQRVVPEIRLAEGRMIVDLPEGIEPRGDETGKRNSDFQEERE